MRATKVLGLMAAGWLVLMPFQAVAQDGAQDNRAEVLGTWYRMILELVRHTPTQTPPVASRAFAYTAIISYEAVASGSGSLDTLAGQLAGLETVPQREAGAVYDDDAVLNAALGRAVGVYFANTGPTGQRAMQALTGAMEALVAEGVTPEVLARSQAFGLALADHVIAASAGDGGAVVETWAFR